MSSPFAGELDTLELFYPQGPSFFYTRYVAPLEVVRGAEAALKNKMPVVDGDFCTEISFSDGYFMLVKLHPKERYKDLSPKVEAILFTPTTAEGGGCFVPDQKLLDGDRSVYHGIYQIEDSQRGFSYTAVIEANYGAAEDVGVRWQSNHCEKGLAT